MKKKEMKKRIKNLENRLMIAESKIAVLESRGFSAPVSVPQDTTGEPYPFWKPRIYCDSYTSRPADGITITG